MQASKFFSLGKTPPFLDFVDIRLATDIPVFVGPTALKSLKSSWGQECTSLVARHALLCRRDFSSHLDLAQENRSVQNGIFIQPRWRA